MSHLHTAIEKLDQFRHHLPVEDSVFIEGVIHDLLSHAVDVSGDVCTVQELADWFEVGDNAMKNFLRANRLSIHPLNPLSHSKVYSKSTTFMAIKEMYPLPNTFKDSPQFNPAGK